jgi:hypothetical protein
MPRVPKIRLYRDIDDEDHWIAWSSNLGRVGLLGRPNGWAERMPVVDLEVLRLREIPLAQAFCMSLMVAFQH